MRTAPNVTRTVLGRITFLPGPDDSLFEISSENDGGIDHAKFKQAFAVMFRSFNE